MTPEEEKRQKERLQLAQFFFREAIAEDTCHVNEAFAYITEWVEAEAERIVEQRLAALEFQSSDIGGKWVDYPSFRVKPKGE